MKKIGGPFLEKNNAQPPTPKTPKMKKFGPNETIQFIDAILDFASWAWLIDCSFLA